MFSIVVFSFSQYTRRLQAIHYNSIRDLIVLPFFFILCLDLTIGLFHVIAQQIQKTKIFVDAGVSF